MNISLLLLHYLIDIKSVLIKIINNVVNITEFNPTSCEIVAAWAMIHIHVYNTGREIEENSDIPCTRVHQQQRGSQLEYNMNDYL